MLLFISVPLILNSVIEQVLGSESLIFRTKHDVGFLASDIENQSYVLKSLWSTSTSGNSMDFQFQDLIEHFEVELIGLEVAISVFLY